jgi:hypothetical protein
MAGFLLAMLARRRTTGPGGPAAHGAHLRANS